MSAGKGSTPRPVDGEKYRQNFAAIFQRMSENEPVKGEVVGCHEYLGEGGWHAIDHHELELRDDE